MMMRLHKVQSYVGAFMENVEFALWSDYRRRSATKGYDLYFEPKSPEGYQTIIRNGATTQLLLEMRICCTESHRDE